MIRSWKLASSCIAFHGSHRAILTSPQRLQHTSTAKAVTLVEDVYNPPDGPSDSDRCLIIAYVHDCYSSDALEELKTTAHGLFGFRTNWRSLAKAFSERAKIQVVTVDMRNHGDSPYSNSMTYFDMAADLLRTVRKHNKPKTILMGHSMGGKAAMLVALQEPTLLRKLIVVDIAPTISASVGEIPAYTRVLLDNLHRIQHEKNVVAARRAMDKIFQTSLESLRQNKGIRDFLLMLIAHDQTSGQFIWRANLEILEEFMPDIMHFPSEFDQATTPVETLFIAGGNSNYITEESTPVIQRLFPSHRLTRIPNAGHWVHSERPREFLECVLPELELK